MHIVEVFTTLSMEVDDQESELVEALFQCTTNDRAVLTKQFLMVSQWELGASYDLPQNLLF